MGRRSHVPLRRCVGCRRVRPQAELLRLARDEAGGWRLDPARRAGGRGSWVCRDTPACWTPKRLGRSFRGQTEAVCGLLSDYASEHAAEHANDHTNHHANNHADKPKPSQTARQTGGLNV